MYNDDRMSSDDEKSHRRGDDSAGRDDRSSTDNQSEKDSHSARDDSHTHDSRQACDDSASARDDGQGVELSYEASNNSHSARDRGPMPWLSLDYEYFETDDRDSSLDENAPGIDDELVAQTDFRAADVKQSSKWEWLQKLNNGYGESERSTQLHEAGVQRDLDIICEQLHCTDHQHDRSKWLLDQIDIKGQLIPDGRIEAAILGVVSMVVDEDRTRYARQGVENMQSVTRDDPFKRLLSEYDIDSKRIRTIRQRLRETEVYESPNN